MAAGREITELLREVRDDVTGAQDELLERLYEELHGLAAAAMRRERSGHTLQPAALVHEAWLNVLGGVPNRGFENRAHFLGAVARAMRRTLIHYARQRASQKRGGGRPREELVELPDMPPLPLEDVVAVHEALEELGAEDPRAARVVELRFFGGAELDEVAQVLGTSTRTVKRDWRFARAWLLRRWGGAS